MWLLHLLGVDSLSGRWYGFWSGFGSDLAELAIIGGLIDVVRRGVKHHKERMAQAERHNTERLAQGTAHHNALLHLHERHHQRMLDAVAASAAVADVQASVSGEPPAATPRARKTKATL